MRLCYQMATPDVARSPAVTAYQGELDSTLRALRAYGYDAVEMMTREPGALDMEQIQALLRENDLRVSLVCTGEIFGQGGLNLTDPDGAVRALALERVLEIVDFAAAFGANINIGRVRGVYRDDVPPKRTEEWAVAAFSRIAEYASAKRVRVALEPVTYLQTNFINTVAEAAEMARRVGNSAFGLMMDLFHMNIEEKRLLSVIEQYAAQCVHVHLADNDRRYPGHGGLDFKAILRAFCQNGYDGDFCAEIYQLPDQDVAARETARTLTPLLADIYGRSQRQ